MSAVDIGLIAVLVALVAGEGAFAFLRGRKGTAPAIAAKRSGTAGEQLVDSFEALKRAKAAEAIAEQLGQQGAAEVREAFGRAFGAGMVPTEKKS